MKNPANYPLASGKVCYVGDGVACVLATSDAAARDALVEQLRGDADAHEASRFDAIGRRFDAYSSYARVVTDDTRLPDDPEILNAAGLAYWARREHSVAEQKFLRATALKADYAEAWNNLGALYVDLGRYEAALAPLGEALKSVFYETRERAFANPQAVRVAPEGHVEGASDPSGEGAPASP